MENYFLHEIKLEVVTCNNVMLTKYNHIHTYYVQTADINNDMHHANLCSSVAAPTDDHDEVKSQSSTSDQRAASIAASYLLSDNANFSGSSQQKYISIIII